NLNLDCEIFEEVWVESDKEYLSQVLDTLLATVVRLAMPDTTLPIRLIGKLRECLVEVEVPELTINKNDFVQVFNMDRTILPKLSREIARNPKLINTLVETLGCDLMVSPLGSNKQGTLIRLSIPLKESATA